VVFQQDLQSRTGLDAIAVPYVLVRPRFRCNRERSRATQLLWHSETASVYLRPDEPRFERRMTHDSCDAHMDCRGDDVRVGRWRVSTTNFRVHRGLNSRRPIRPMSRRSPRRSLGHSKGARGSTGARMCPSIDEGERIFQASALPGRDVRVTCRRRRCCRDRRPRRIPWRRGQTGCKRCRRSPAKRQSQR
jgi:hypothetical protein